MGLDLLVALFGLGTGVLSAYITATTFIQNQRKEKDSKLELQKVQYAEQKVRDRDIERDLRHFDRRISELASHAAELHRENEIRFDAIESTLQETGANIRLILNNLKEFKS